MTNTSALSTSAMDSWSPAQVEIIKTQICKDSTDVELSFFLATCQRTGLDPFQRQIFAVKRQGQMTVQIAIDGFRLIAERTGRYQGQTQPQWCGPDGIWTDVWLNPEPPAAAKVGVCKSGFLEPLIRVALWKEFAQITRDGNPVAMWAKFPALMLAKCAESQALRAAFPAEMSGLYTVEEMSQAIDVEAAVIETAPTGESPQSKCQRVKAARESAGLTTEQVKSLLTNFGVESPAELTTEDVNTVIDIIESMKQ